MDQHVGNDPIGMKSAVAYNHNSQYMSHTGPMDT